MNLLNYLNDRLKEISNAIAYADDTDSVKVKDLKHSYSVLLEWKNKVIEEWL